MRIGIDAHVIGKRKTGVETYTKNIINELTYLDSENEYFILLSPSGSDFSTAHKFPVNFYFPVLNTESLLLQRFILIPQAVSRNKIDVLQVSRVTPLFCSAKTIINIYDLAHQEHPEFFQKRETLAMNYLMRRSVKKADKIITISPTSKQNIINRYGISESKIAVIPLAVDLSRYRPMNVQNNRKELEQKYKIKSPFLLFVGALEPRKNLVYLIKTFAKLKKLNSLPHKLVIVGSERKENQGYLAELEKTINSLGLKEEVRLTGYIDEEDMPLFYNAADIFIFPSLLEGFGLPPLEAMAAGTATIVADIAPLRETVKGGALLVDPKNEDDLASLIYRLVKKPEWLRELGGKGRKTAESYSWRNTAKKTLQVYQEIYYGKAGS